MSPSCFNLEHECKGLADDLTDEFYRDLKDEWIEQKRAEFQQAQLRRRRCMLEDQSKPAVSEAAASAHTKRLWLDQKRRDQDAQLHRRRRLEAEAEGRAPLPAAEEADRFLKQRWLDERRQQWEGEQSRRHARLATSAPPDAKARLPLPEYKGEARALSVLDQLTATQWHEREWQSMHPLMIRIDRI